jgi:hypothetical protein
MAAISGQSDKGAAAAAAKKYLRREHPKWSRKTIEKEGEGDLKKFFLFLIYFTRFLRSLRHTHKKRRRP